MAKIKEIQIERAEFYAPDFSLEFSGKLNCLMGGRGTGKSTILHFIKSCLEYDAEEEKDTYNILKANLGAGIVNILCTNDDGESFKITKSFGEDPQAYNGQGDLLHFEAVAREFRCDIFPAQKIEEIGRNPQARLELIDSMIADRIGELSAKLDELAIELDKNAKEIRGENKRLERLQESLLEFSNADDELATHKQNPEDVNAQEQKEFEKEDAAEKVRSAERRTVKKVTGYISGHAESMSEFTEALNTTREYVEAIDNVHNKEIIEPVKKELETALLIIVKNASAIESQLTIAQRILGTTEEKLTQAHEVQHNAFIKLKQRLDKNKAFYDKLNALTQRVDKRDVLRKEIEEINARRKKLKAARIKNMATLQVVREEMLAARLEKANELNRIFQGSIKITITPGGITGEYDGVLRNALKGHNLRYNTIVPYLVDNFSPDELAKVVHANDAEKLRQVTSIDIERSKAILEALHETEAIYAIEAMYCPDLPDFYLKIDKEESPEEKSVENYKKSDELSTGQRCTTVLPIIFALSRNPLIIDQPEDNLDNKYISETIHNIIRQQKEERQLIFITHNANIPVLSASEKNYFLRFDDKQSHVADQGNVNEVKDSILNLLEGGKQAFEKRKNLYGF